MASMRKHCEAIVRLQSMGSVAVDYGNNLRGMALDAGFEDAFAYPGFIDAHAHFLGVGKAAMQLDLKHSQR